MKTNAPQIIYLLITVYSLILSGYKHGKPKKGNNNAVVDVISLLIGYVILFWGGFF